MSSVILCCGPLLIKIKKISMIFSKTIMTLVLHCKTVIFLKLRVWCEVQIQSYFLICDYPFFTIVY